MPKNGITQRNIEKAVAEAKEHGTASFANENIDFISNLLSLSQKCSSLEKLDFEHNNITVLNNLPPLARLEYLDVSFNKIEIIQTNFPFPNLKVFAARNNKIRAISCEFPASIEVIDLENNEISNEPDIECCFGVEVLELKGNPLDQSKHSSKQLVVSSYVEKLDNEERSLTQTNRFGLGSNYEYSKAKAPIESNKEYNEAYEELITIYESQLQQQWLSFPNPSLTSEDFELIKRRLFEYIYDSIVLRGKNAQLVKQLEQCESQINQEELRNELLSEEKEEMENESANFECENQEIEHEIEQYFEHEQSTMKQLSLIQSSLIDFMDLEKEEYDDINDNIDIINKKINKLQFKIKDFKINKASSINRSVQVDVVVEETVRFTETELLLEDKSVENSQGIVELEEAGVQTEDFIDEIQYEAAKNDTNPLLMSNHEFEEYRKSIKPISTNLQESDLSVLQIARKYFPEEQQAANQAEEEFSIRYFGIRPQSYVSEQLNQLDLE